MNETEDVRERTIREMFPLVKKIARRVHRLVPTSDAGDLIGEGCVGLIRAVDSFDASRGTTLQGFAARLIAGAMLNGLRRMDPISERVRRELRDAERERYALAHAGSLPSQHEMEHRRPKLRRAAFHAYRYVPLSLDGPLPLGESLSPDWDTDTGAIAAAQLDREGVHSALRSLSPRQRRVLHLHYFAGQSLHEIGRAMAISPQRASQLHKAALKRLRKVMHAPH
jgi:RNA polymerase sigma factor for flagellar operon FliA